MRKDRIGTKNEKSYLAMNLDFNGMKYMNYVSNLIHRFA